MSDNQEKKQASSLAPIKEKDRIMSWGSNTMLWLGGCISIGTLTMGSAQLEKGLNLVQLFAAVFIGSLILVIGIALNDQFSYKTGAPYAIQLKSAPKKYQILYDKLGVDLMVEAGYNPVAMITYLNKIGDQTRFASPLFASYARQGLQSEACVGGGRWGIGPALCAGC